MVCHKWRWRDGADDGTGRETHRLSQPVGELPAVAAEYEGEFTKVGK